MEGKRYSRRRYEEMRRRRLRRTEILHPGRLIRPWEQRCMSSQMITRDC